MFILPRLLCFRIQLSLSGGDMLISVYLRYESTSGQCRYLVFLLRPRSSEDLLRRRTPTGSNSGSPRLSSRAALAGAYLPQASNSTIRATRSDELLTTTLIFEVVIGVESVKTRIALSLPVTLQPMALPL